MPPDRGVARRPPAASAAIAGTRPWRCAPPARPAPRRHAFVTPPPIDHHGEGRPEGLAGAVPGERNKPVRPPVSDGGLHRRRRGARRRTEDSEKGDEKNGDRPHGHEPPTKPTEGAGRTRAVDRTSNGEAGPRAPKGSSDRAAARGAAPRNVRRPSRHGGADARGVDQPGRPAGRLPITAPAALSRAGNCALRRPRRAR